MAEVVRAHSAEADTAAALAEIESQLAGTDPAALVFFCSANHDGVRIERALKAKAPNAEVIGCTTGGEFTDTAYTQGGVAVVVLSKAKVKRCAATLADYSSTGVEAAVHQAAGVMAQKLGVKLRDIDPEHWVGLVLNEGLKGHEQEVNAVLGHVAPFLSFLGGSAGDNFRLQETRVFHDGRESNDGSVFLLLELSVPYTIVKTCSLEPTDTKMRIDRTEGRVVYEIDGKPAVAAYAEKAGVKPEDLGHMVFMSNPLGVIVDGEPWVRSPIMVTPDGGLMFGCQIIEGSELSLLRATDLVSDTQRALDQASEKLGTTPSVGILFNCAHRCMEIQAKQLEEPFRKAIAGFPVAGFHSYGESYLAHMNQTLIGLLLG